MNTLSTSVLEHELFCFQMGAEVTIAEPIKACSPIANAEELKHRIAVIERGECMFIDKVWKKSNRVSETQWLHV